jgi:xylulokinase
MNDDAPLFLGIDLGTSGVRAMAVAEDGRVAADASAPLATAVATGAAGWHEQSPAAWWQAVCQALALLADELRAAGIHPQRLAAVAVDGTSGTVVALDESGSPLRPALMYNDSRATAEAELLNEVAADFCQKLGYRFQASFALAKILWLQRHESEMFRSAAWFVHQADYIQGRLTGVPGVSDYSNALKTGYDLLEERWPAWIDAIGPLRERLPRVVAVGSRIGEISAAVADQLGLPHGLPVVAGATDGTAAFVASGVHRPGDYNTTLGTTLVFKGASRRICSHPDGLIYCHKLPDGLWLPGAASNTGGEWIAHGFADADLWALDAAAVERLPCECIAYPLARTGERFPFRSATAQGFWLPEPDDRSVRYAAGLQGVALVERLCYDVLDEATGGRGGEVYSTGGGSRSDVWMQCRADVTGRVFHRPQRGESAFGAAVLAAGGGLGCGLQAAIRQMVRLDRSFTPDTKRKADYDRLFGRFRDELRRRGWIGTIRNRNAD